MTVNEELASIARRHLRMVTLEARNSDSLDFHDLSVWELRRALAAAYKAGFEAGEKAGRP